MGNKQSAPMNVFQAFCFALSVSFLMAPACSVTGSSSSVDESDIYFSDLTGVPDWNDVTHAKLSNSEITANLGKVFDTSQLQTLRIVIEPENWAVMQANLSDLKNNQGRSRDFSGDDDPIFVPCDVFYEGTQWYKVGVRFKGNSSLYHADSNKLPFKLDFDEFEDQYPAIENQRFYGFKQLNLKNNYKDESEMHEVVANQLFRHFGLVASHSSFYKLYLNVDGSSENIYYGLYSLVEEVDDTVIKTQYGDDGGNLYKPTTSAATFASGTYDKEAYDLKTDHDETFSDIAQLYNAVNDSSRITDPDAWKSALEEIFDVDVFLKWLAANTIIQNWDSYGVMSQNYYLYNNPQTNMFEWIPWDHNESLDGDNRCLSLSMSSVGSSWPLIRYLLNVDSYANQYKVYVDDFADTVFFKTSMDSMYDAYRSQIESAVLSEGSSYTFTSSSLFSAAVEELKSHTEDRNSAANSYAGID